LEQNIPGQRQGVSAALAAAQARAAVAAVHFPGEDNGRSLADMAQRDLDAALQLLADRAQYITGASGAAIALRRNGRDDMLCRASVGSNAPELGALLSTEFGLSGESVRTRQLLRCDDAERDARVNREVCRQMGIASVLVMPVVNDDQVLGVFELFSGKPNAFGERDLSAVQRLSEMVETAVRLAHATENLPEQLSERERSVAEAIHPEVFEGQFLGDLVVEESKEDREHQSVETIAASALESPVDEPIPQVPEIAPKAILPKPQTQVAVPAVPAPSTPANSVPVKKLLFWSAAATGDGEAPGTGNADQSHVPPVLRGLRKCEACGFPISAGRVLCVECEEKKWRGQLRPQSSERKPSSEVRALTVSTSSGSFAAAAASMAKSQTQTQSSADPGPKVAAVASGPEVQAEQRKPATSSAVECEISGVSAEVPELVLSAGLEPQRSWFSANKYILLALLAIGASMAAFLALR
jgi:GAF domain-containing protein